MGGEDRTDRLANICPFVVTDQGGVKISGQFGKSGGESVGLATDIPLVRF